MGRIVLSIIVCLLFGFHMAFLFLVGWLILDMFSLEVSIENKDEGGR